MITNCNRENIIGWSSPYQPQVQYDKFWERYTDILLFAKIYTNTNTLLMDYVPQETPYKWERDPKNKNISRKKYTVSPEQAFVYIDPYEHAYSVGIDWTKIDKITGKTGLIKDYVKDMGYRWNSIDKAWER